MKAYKEARWLTLSLGYQRFCAYSQKYKSKFVPNNRSYQKNCSRIKATVRVFNTNRVCHIWLHVSDYHTFWNTERW